MNSWKLIVFLLLSGCQHSAWTSVDPWYRPPPTTEIAWMPVPEGAFHIVPPATRNKAVALLEKQAAIPIKAELAVTLMEQQGEYRDAWLVRGLCLACESGPLRVYQSQSREALLVSHASLSKRALPMTRSPIIIEGLDYGLSSTWCG